MRTSTLVVLVAVLAIAIFAQVSKACFASGVCGPACPPPPPPPPASCGGCNQGYACGHYGCYNAMRARMHSSKTFKVGQAENGANFDAAPKSPDEKFMTCCRERKLPDSCLTKCTYETFTKNSLQAMYFRQDSCPMQAAAEIQFCAAQGRDHRECCARNGVGQTLSGQKCLLFCDQRPGKVTQLDVTYMACYERFDSMKACFYQDVTQGAGKDVMRHFDNL
ncbi:hypothetical protein L596_013465 [Steinernema carpocapsae]|uniref:Domain of unknown function DB domain-containing protein n=1 Tax=Steinernema carpocapsae TaxID=34508 RepID=A0A4U5P141_STECR|nr:hypothetical protein L596_013465 [Steinernema carpocapsae]